MLKPCSNLHSMMTHELNDQSGGIYRYQSVLMLPRTDPVSLGCQPELPHHDEILARSRQDGG